MEPTVKERIAIIRDFPTQIEQLTSHLSVEQLHTAYNAPEWTIAQNIHHVADAHMIGFSRFKLGITEDSPALFNWKMDEWAKLNDVVTIDPANSRLMLHGLHRRWVVLLESITDWSRPVQHPIRGIMTLDDLLTLYANHCQAHLKQIREVMEKM